MHLAIEFLLHHRIQVLSVLGSLFLLAYILKLVKRKRLKEEYSLLWLAFSIIFLVLSVFRPFLEIVADALGIIYAPAALLLVLVISIFFILIQFSLVISTLTEANKNLVQEVGILKSEIKAMQAAHGEDK